MSLIGRLAWSNLRARPGQAGLLLVVLILATGTLSLALAVNETGDRPWERMWQRTNGGHIYAEVFHRPDLPPDDPALVRARAELAALPAAPGVEAAGGPWRSVFTNGVVAGVRMELIVASRDSSPGGVGHPLVTGGQWLDGGDGVVLEDGLASVLPVAPGDTITVTGLTLPVRGVASSVSAGRFPMHQPGRIWANPSTVDKLRAAGAEDFTDAVELRLADPAQAGAFAATHRREYGIAVLDVTTWEQLRDNAHDELSIFAIALLVIGTLLAWLTIATAAVLVASRMAAQIRQVGTLKAVGVTPGQITRVLLLEYCCLAAVASAVGIVVGTLLSPVAARNMPSLYGAPEAPAITWQRSAVVVAVAAAVVLLGTVRPAIRGARRSTIRSLGADVLPPPRRPSRLARWALRSGVPLPAVLGLRAALRRPGRLVANAAGFALGLAMVMIALAIDGGIDRFLASRPRNDVEDAVSAGLEQALIDRLQAIVTAAGILLIALATVNVVVVAIFAARDSARNHAILRAVGATPRQTVTAFLVSQLGSCLLACAVGIPLGVFLFNTLGGDLAPARLSALTYAAVVVGAPLLCLATVAVPARLLARQPVAPLLTYE